MAAFPIPLASTNLCDAFSRIREIANPKKKYLEYELHGNPQALSFCVVENRISKLGGMFGNWGMCPGDRVLVASRDAGALATIVMACLRFGLSSVILDPGAPEFEATPQIKAACVKAALVDESLAMEWEVQGINNLLLISEEKSETGDLFRRLLGGKSNSQQRNSQYPGILSSLRPSNSSDQIDDELEAYVLFTSGSTESPKGVRISRRSLFAHAQTLTRQWGHNEKSRVIDVLPLHHTDGLVQGLILSWLNYATCIRPVEFSIANIGELLDSVYTFRATHFIAVPTMLALLDKYGENYREAFKTQDFRILISTAGLLEPSLWRRFEDRFGVQITNFYGLTETVTGGIFCGPGTITRRLGTIGKPVDCVAKVVNARGEEVERGEVGELTLKGDMVMLGYLNDDKSTQEAIRDGWLYTGDVASVDEDGFFRVSGRMKETIITGGKNVMPTEVNAALLSIPEVAEAISFGLDDDIFGEIVAACVELKENDALSVEELASKCRSRLTDYKVPKAIQIVQSLPRNSMGKFVLSQVKGLFEDP